MQVLSDPAQRELYDLQHDASSSQFLRRAASEKRCRLLSSMRIAAFAVLNWQQPSWDLEMLQSFVMVMPSRCCRASDEQRVQYGWQWVNDLQDTRPARQVGM